MRLRLTPRDTSFFDLFAAQAQHLVTGANLLGEILGADRPTVRGVSDAGPQKRLSARRPLEAALCGARG